MKSATRTLREHLHFIIIVPLLIIVMTWPTFVHVFDSDGFWLPSHEDMYMKVWDAWYGKLMLSGQAEFYSADLLFYPNGLSLDFHNFSLPHMFVFGGLQEIIPAANAYILTFWLIILANAISANVLFIHWFRNKWIALAGTIVFGLSPYVVSRPQHPEVMFVATIPLALYAFDRGVVERRWKWLGVAGVLAGITTHIGMYTFVCLLLTLSIYALYLASTHWREPYFRKGIFLVLALTAVISIPRIFPMIAHTDRLNEALDKASWISHTSDLLDFFVNARHPRTESVFRVILGRQLPSLYGDGYLGYLPLLLIGFGLFHACRRRKMLPWLVAALFFAILRLGDVLVIDNQIYADILLPRHYLANIFPWIFKAFWNTAHFQIGVLLPFAVLFCFGLKQVLLFVAPRWQPTAILIIVLLVSFERYQRPRAAWNVEDMQPNWMDWLGSEEKQESIHVINLPMGRRYSKQYGYYQTLNGYPHAEGLASRTPSEAYTYIDSNLLLSTWRAGKIINCLPDNYGEFINAQNQLLADGFTHIILHHDLFRGQSTTRNFFNTPRSYQDEFASVYLVEDLLRNCDVPALLSKAAQTNVERAKESVVFPRNGSSILSIQHYSAGDDEARQSYSAVLYNMRGFVPLDDNDISEASAPNSNSLEYGPNTTLAANSAILFAYDPQSAAPALIESYRRWVSHQFNSCGLVSSTANSEIEYFLRMGFSCDLAITDNPLEIHYDNNIQLGNLLPIPNENALDLYLLWKRLPEDSHSVSIQFFDNDGNKALGQDFVIGLEPLAHHRINMSALEPGDYQVKLIVYNFETRVSVPGTVISADAHFDRELEIMRLTIK